jgi:hypothetical protein
VLHSFKARQGGRAAKHYLISRFGRIDTIGREPPIMFIWNSRLKINISHNICQNNEVSNDLPRDVTTPLKSLIHEELHRASATVLLFTSLLGTKLKT